MKKGISILGSTGSIGRQTLEVVSIFPSALTVVAMAAKDEVDLIVEQIKKFSPKLVSVESEAVKQKVEAKLGPSKVEIATGSEGLLRVATEPSAKLVVAAIPGSLSLLAVLEAVKAKKDIALATKEVLVTAGDLFMQEVKASGVKIFPIDSEHSAISQCLRGEDHKTIQKLIITASGGPFLKTPKEKFATLTAKDALAHPTWKMGPKITVDSATLMNKGLEIIEAHHLFGVAYDHIDVVVHPGSTVHSLVEFADGAMLAQMGTPDMRLPLQYAINGQHHWPLDCGRLDLTALGPLRFEKPDTERFPCLALARAAGRVGGSAPVVLNAANEIAVAALLAGHIRFTDIGAVVAEALAREPDHLVPDLVAVLETDRRARALAETIVHERSR